MKALLLCAGFGTRMKPYSDVLPKPAIPVLNVPAAYYSLHLIQQLGVRNVVVNTHHLPDKIEELFSQPEELNIQVSFSHEEGQILDTGGAIGHARKLLEGQ